MGVIKRQLCWVHLLIGTETCSGDFGGFKEFGLAKFHCTASQWKWIWVLSLIHLGCWCGGHNKQVFR